MQEAVSWLEESVFGKCVLTMLISMVPVFELRAGLPIAAGALRLPYWLAFPAAVLGNIIPVPFIVVYIRRVFQWIRRHIPKLNGMVDTLEQKASSKSEQVRKYKKLGLWLFVAIPLPGTGAWTGSLVAAFLNMRLRDAFPAIVLGVITAGCIMLALTHVGINLFSSISLPWI